MPNLPKELRIRRIRTILIRVISCALLLALMATIIYFWGDQILPFPRKLRAFQKVGYVVLMLLPFLVTGVPLKLIDKSWCGEIVAVDVNEKLAGHSIGGASIIPYKQNHLVLTIRKEDGKKIKFTAMSLGIQNPVWYGPYVVGKMEYQSENFKVGDKVCKYYGYKHIYVVPDPNDTRAHCVVCGCVNKGERSRCLNCQSKLITEGDTEP